MDLDREALSAELKMMNTENTKFADVDLSRKVSRFACVMAHQGRTEVRGIRTYLRLSTEGSG